MEREQLIQTAIEAHLAGTGDSANSLSTKAGVSSATISNMRAGKWSNIAQTMWNKVGAFLGVQGEAWPLFETPNFRRVLKVCQDAQEQHKMLGISAYTGAGKSTALSTYARQNGNCYYVLCRMSMTPRQFMATILKSMGLQEVGSINEGVKAASGRLNEVGSGLLILDDAGKLSDRNMGLIQEIYDEVEFQAGIVLAGTEHLKEYIDKMAAKGKRNFPEFQSRVMAWQGLVRPSKTVVVQIAQAHGIEDGNAHAYLARVTPNYRTLRNLITNARLATAGNPDVVVSAELLAGLHVGDHNYHQA